MHVYPDTDGRLLAPLPRTARQAQQLHKQSDLQRISIVSQLGITPYAQCWCGIRLTLDYSIGNGGDEAMTARLTAFLNDHESCSPPEKDGIL